MTKYKRCAPIGGKKPIWIIVEDGKIISENPSKEELKDLKEEPFKYSRNRTINLIKKSEIIDENKIEKRYNETDICDGCKKEELIYGKTCKEYKEGKWTGRWLCNKCYMKYYNKVHKFWDTFKPITNCRSGNQNPNHSNTKGNKFQKLTCVWKCVDDLNIRYDNCISPIDHSPSPDGIIYQTKGKLYDHINRFWILNCQNEHDKNFDFLIFYCASKEGKYIERIYIIPKEEIIKRKTITIYKKPSKGKSWYEEYRVKDLDELKKVNDIWKKIL